MHIPAHIFICLCMCTHTYVHMVAEYFCPLLRDDGCLLFQRHTTEWQRLMSQRVGQVNFIHTITVRLGGGQSRGGLPSFIPLLCLAGDSSVVLSSRNGCQEEQEARQPSTPVFQKDSQCSVFRF